jgi:hypothetical protein
MTIARKLWLGFGVVVSTFLVASLIIFFSQSSISNALNEIANVEEPTRDASQEMEINLLTQIATVFAHSLDAADDSKRYLGVVPSRDSGEPRFLRARGFASGRTRLDAELRRYLRDIRGPGVKSCRTVIAFSLRSSIVQLTTATIIS